MVKSIINGNKELAQVLGVSTVTIWNWKKSGILAPAILIEFGRIIRYDLDKVIECLQYRRDKPGRKRQS